MSNQKNTFNKQFVPTTKSETPTVVVPVSEKPMVEDKIAESETPKVIATETEKVTVEIKATEVSSIESGAVVASTSVPVGITSTKEEVVAVKEQKKETSSGLILSKEVLSLVDRLAATNNQVAINAIAAIMEYMVKMGPGKTMTLEEGNRHQVTLFRAIRSVIEFTGEEFQLAMVLMLRLFDEYKNDVFHERYVFRFMDSIPLSQDERRAFERILNLIKISAAVSGRKEALRQVNFQKTLQYVFSENSKQKLMSFFNI